MTVLAELAELYENPGADLPGIGLTFRDFVVGHRRDGREVEEAEGYWRSRLPELPPAPQLPLAADPSTVGEGGSSACGGRLPSPNGRRSRKRPGCTASHPRQSCLLATRGCCQPGAEGAA